jgi:hypothetical protein
MGLSIQGGQIMTKYNVLISYVVEAEDEMRAVFALNKSLYPLSENELEKFNAFHVEEVSQ